METGRPVRRLLQIVLGEGNDGDHIGVTGFAWGCKGSQEMFWKSKHQDLRGRRQRNVKSRLTPGCLAWVRARAGPSSERPCARRSRSWEVSSLEHVAFEVPDGAKTDCPGVGWTLWPEPCGRRRDGPARSVVGE